MRKQGFFVVGVVIALVAPSSTVLGAMQLPLAPVRASGQTVTPVFGGWYHEFGRHLQPFPSATSTAIRKKCWKSRSDPTTS